MGGRISALSDGSLNTLEHREQLRIHPGLRGNSWHRTIHFVTESQRRQHQCDCVSPRAIAPPPALLGSVPFHEKKKTNQKKKKKKPPTKQQQKNPPLLDGLEQRDCVWNSTLKDTSTSHAKSLKELKFTQSHRAGCSCDRLKPHEPKLPLSSKARVNVHVRVGASRVRARPLTFPGTGPPRGGGAGSTCSVPALPSVC